MSGEDRRDATEVLDRIGFDPASNVLTQRQAEILLLRRWGYSQAAIAEQLCTSRANVTNIQGSAEENVAKARETVRVVEAMAAPVRVSIDAGTDVYEIPELVYDACNDVDLKVAHTAPQLIKRLLEDAEDAIDGRTVERPLTVSVNVDGDVEIRQPNADPP